MREIAAEWTGRSLDELVAGPDWALTSWGLLEGEYERLHRFAVTQRDLFVSMKPIPGAPQALRRLGTGGHPHPDHHPPPLHKALPRNGRRPRQCAGSRTTACPTGICASCAARAMS